MAVRFEVDGRRLGVRIKGKIFGAITTGGRWPGRFKHTGPWADQIRVSGEDLQKIAEKCIEIRQQVESDCNLRRTHFR